MTIDTTESLSPNVLLPAPQPSVTWRPKRVIFTPEALDTYHGQRIWQRAEEAGLPLERLAANRLTGLRGATDAETYRLAKQTLAVVIAPPSQMRLQPIPPSADWQFHLAQGCPAHCQYCYLAGSLSGPPVTRVYANLEQILENTLAYRKPGQLTSFEASCYTDPLVLEPLTGGVAEAVQFFGQQEGMHLRLTSKFGSVDDLLSLPHNGHTRIRQSLTAPTLARAFEAGTDTVAARIAALRKLALAGYPIGVTLAPIMAVESWEGIYTELFDLLAAALADIPALPDLTFECITHRFTEASKAQLMAWYPATKLEMDPARRRRKFGKFGGPKFVLRPEQMIAMQAWFRAQISTRFPQARMLYWT